MERDCNGATAISYSSWAIRLAEAAATVIYAKINIWDVWLALITARLCLGCLVFIRSTAFKRYATPEPLT